MNKIRQVLLHLITWIAVIGLFMYIVTNGQIVHATIVIFVYFGLINISVFYFNYLLILPAFLDRRKYLWCALTMIFLVLVSGFVKCGLAYYFYDIVLVRGQTKHIMGFWDYYSSAAFVSCFFIFLSTVLKFMTDWFLNEKIKSNLENEKLISELAFLKSQINPHFLFNSLNNIYSLAYQKSDKTPEAILKLSEIMRYMLYESNENKVALSDEIRYLENYIELQKLRFKNAAYIKFEINGDIQNQTITPLVLISFVENAFKHGVATDKENPIRIVLNVASDKLFFQVINKKNNQNKDDTGGIGLQNVKRRLDLLYRAQYRFHIEDNQDLYNCELYLNLSNDTLSGS
jgi:two-component system LytT family sensor kinase